MHDVQVRSYCGHGIGSLFHCAPNIPHYAKNKAVGQCKPGMVFTIEPMINLGRYHDVLWLDDWTAVAADGTVGDIPIELDDLGLTIED